MKEDISLDDLARKLRVVKSRGLATQKELQEVTGVDQAAISRVLNGQRRRATEPLGRLREYVNMLLDDGQLSEEIQEAARDFLGRGGTEAELIASIEHSGKLVSGKLR